MNTNIPREALEDLGKKSLSPILDVFTRHRDDFTPYTAALHRALSAGAEALAGGGTSGAEKFIGDYFRTAADFVSDWEVKLRSRSPEEIYRFIEDEGKKHPLVLFGASYVAGAFLGRLGLHIRKSSRSNEETIH